MRMGKLEKICVKYIKIHIYIKVYKNTYKTLYNTNILPIIQY